MKKFEECQLMNKQPFQFRVYQVIKRGKTPYQLIINTSGSTTSFVSSNIIERARATRFFMPPDNSDGIRSSTPCTKNNHVLFNSTTRNVKIFAHVHSNRILYEFMILQNKTVINSKDIIVTHGLQQTSSSTADLFQNLRNSHFNATSPFF